MKKIYFWSPFNSKIGTVNSVINSIKFYGNCDYSNYLKKLI